MAGRSLYAERVVADGASHYWRLNEASGTVASDSVGTAHGTISGGVTLGQSGALADGSTAMLFNGTTGTIVTAVASALLTPFTLEVWVRRNSNTSVQVVFCNSWGVGDNLAFFIDGPTVLAYTGVAGPSCAFPYDTLWHHLVLVAAGGVGGHFYIDGLPVASGDATPLTFTAGVAKAFEIGFDPNWNHYNGSLDEVAIYPRALTATEIAAHYALRTAVLLLPPVTLVPSIDVQLAPGVWTPLAPDVVASAGVRATRGISGSGPMDRVAMPGILTFTLRNDAGNSGHTLGWYSPDHNAVRPGWTAGIPVRLSLTYDETAYRIWTGRIRTIAPEPGRHLSRYVEVTAQDAIADLTETIVREIAPQINQTEDDLVAAVIAAIPASVQPPLALDPGLDTLPYVFDDLGDGASALQLLSDVMLSSFGTLFVAPDGTLTYRNRQTQSQQTSSDTFTEDDLINDGGLVLTSGLGSVYNRVRATVHPRTLAPTVGDVLFGVTGTILVAPGQTVTVWGSYADQSNTLRTIGGTDFQPITWYGDVEANSAPTGGGTDLTTLMYAVAQPFASSVRFDVTNTGGTPAYLVTAAGVPKLQLRGRAIYDNAPLTVETVTPQPYGDRLLNLDLKYQDDVEVAQGMVDLLESLYQDPRNRVVRVGINPQRSVRHLLAAVEREVGDVLTISEPVTGISSAQLMIRGVEWDIQLARPALVRTWWATAPSIALIAQQWILDDAVLSVLDETTILGVA